MSTPAHEGDMPDPFDCQEFHNLCMDYRGTSKHMQSCYERLQTYCRAALSQSRAPVVAGEVVAWQIRRNDGSPLATWETCTEEAFMLTRSTGRYMGFANGPTCDARALYAALQPPTAVAAARVPMTEAEIIATRQAVRSNSTQPWADSITFARTIEAFHDIVPPAGGEGETR